MELAAGGRVTQSIELTRPLSEGGMGAVWVARHHGLDIDVAVKFILSELAAQGPQVLERFKREARAAAQIKSPNVVQVLDYGSTESGVPFMVMELLEGETLGDRLERGPLPVADVARMVNQVAGVLAKAHSVGVVHRDIKPDNIFLLSSEERLFVKVLDFGVAKEMKQDEGRPLTADGSLVGTAQYMSPEQLLGQVVDHRADIWALSTVAFEALTGRTPVDGQTFGEVLLNVNSGKFHRATQLRPGIPPQVDTFFAQAFNLQLEHRFSSVRALADALLQILFPDRTSNALLPSASQELRAVRVRNLMDAQGPASAAPRSSGTSGQMAVPDLELPVSRPPQSRGSAAVQRQPVSRPRPASQQRPISQARLAQPAALDASGLDLDDDFQSGLVPLASQIPGSGGSARTGELASMQNAVHATTARTMTSPTSSKGGNRAPAADGEATAGARLGSLTALVFLSVFYIAGAELLLGGVLGANEITFSSAAVGGLLGAISLWAYADRPQGFMLFIGGLAGLLFAIAGGIMAAHQLAPEAGLGPHVGWLHTAARLAAAGVPLAMSLFGMIRGFTTFADSRRYGALLVVLGLVGLGVTYEVARGPLGQMGVDVPSWVPIDLQL